jgi:hypothetical protein
MSEAQAKKRIEEKQRMVNIEPRKGSATRRFSGVVNKDQVLSSSAFPCAVRVAIMGCCSEQPPLSHPQSCLLTDSNSIMYRSGC